MVIISGNKKLHKKRHLYATRSSNRKLYAPLKHNYIKTKKIWISPSSIYNYMIKDTIVDWLKLYKNKNRKKKNRKKKIDNIPLNFSDFIMNKGKNFETELVKYINNNKIPVITVSNYITDETVKKTKELMFQGVPLIHSAPIKNYKNHTTGVIDLLIRSDYLHKLVNINPLSKQETNIYSKKLDKPYYYIVIDIKFSTLPLRSNGINIMNTGSYPAYKAQTWIYTQGVGEIQGYTSRYAYILGRRWNYKYKDSKYNSFNCIDKLGTIDFENIDKEYKTTTKKALDWVIDLNKNGHKWSVNPPTRIELYPNMCKDSGKWQLEKEKIATNIGEITSIWYCTQKHRDFAINNNILSWHDPRCITKNMNFKQDGVRSITIDKMLNINRQSTILIEPSFILTNIFDWKTPANEIFVDFETIADIFSPFDNLPIQSNSNIIFLIGIYYKNYINNCFEYIKFVAHDNTYNEEYKIMTSFVSFFKEKNPKMWYWYAEDSIWKNAVNRQYNLALKNNDKTKLENIKNWQNLNWNDMYKIFITANIVIKDCFSFGLKAISNAMKKHNMINTQCQSLCKNGSCASLEAFNIYNNKKDIELLSDIILYNKYDVQVLHDILEYLRDNHTK